MALKLKKKKKINESSKVKICRYKQMLNLYKSIEYADQMKNICLNCPADKPALILFPDLAFCLSKDHFHRVILRPKHLGVQYVLIKCCQLW